MNLSANIPETVVSKDAEQIKRRREPFLPGLSLPSLSAIVFAHFVSQTKRDRRRNDATFPYVRTEDLSVNCPILLCSMHTQHT